MKKFVYLFGALLILFVTQNILGGDHDWKNKDHKGFYRSPIKIGADFSYLKSTSAYDADGNKHDFSGGDSFTRLREALYVYYHGGKIGDTKVNWGADAELAIIQTKLKPGDMQVKDYSFNGFTFTPGVDIGVRRIAGIRLGAKLGVKYQIDGTKDESDLIYLPEYVSATDRQNALGMTLDLMSRISHGIKLNAGVQLWNTFAGTETQQVFNYETYQVEDMDVDYDLGNQFAVYGGGDYKWCWGDCGWGYAGVDFSFWNRTNQSYNGETIDKTSASYTSLIPEFGFRGKKTPIDVTLSGSSKNEYGIKQGIVGLSGKNYLKPSIALTFTAKYRF